MCLSELGSELATQHKVRHAASVTAHISSLRAEMSVRRASPHHTAEGRSTTEAEVSEVLDDSIAKACKLDYSIAVVSVFSCVFPHPSAYDMFNADTAHYLSRLSYLVLGQC